MQNKLPRYDLQILTEKLTDFFNGHIIVDLNLVLTLILTGIEQLAKGQIISEGNCDILNLTETNEVYFQNLCLQNGSIKKNKGALFKVKVHLTLLCTLIDT